MMKPRDEVVFKFSVIINDHFKQAVKSGLVADLESVGKATSEYLDFALSEREEQIIELLESMIKDWESNLGEDDKTLYSLGLRRAIDKIVGGSSG
jgi:hypothetical protein